MVPCAEIHASYDGFRLFVAKDPIFRAGLLLKLKTAEYIITEVQISEIFFRWTAAFF